MRPNPDLTRQLLERKERLKFLIGFINENGALGKVHKTYKESMSFLTIAEYILYRCRRQADNAWRVTQKSCTQHSNFGLNIVTI